MKLNRISIVALVLTLVVLVPTAGAAQAEREVIDLSERGPQVGETIPNFSLTDQNGDTWTQDSILGENGTMLVFVRSANW